MSSTEQHRAPQDDYTTTMASMAVATRSCGAEARPGRSLSSDSKAWQLKIALHKKCYEFLVADVDHLKIKCI